MKSERVGIVGAGMMGRDLAYICARAGHDVVLNDISQERIDRALERCTKLAQYDGAQRIASKTQNERADVEDSVLSRIKGSVSLEDLRDRTLVIESVFEDPPLKRQVLTEIESLIRSDALWASNTSAIPIAHLAEVARYPERVIGLHFFSPAHRMRLVEVVRTAHNDQLLVDRALEFVTTLDKTAIVINDAYGLYTTRVFAGYIYEGAEMVAAGVSPAVIDAAAVDSGMALGPLRIFDEVSLTLGHRILAQGRSFGYAREITAGSRLVERLIDEFGRQGRCAGAGFYHYDGAQRRLGPWSGLEELGGDDLAHKWPNRPEDIGSRLLLIQALEAVRALEMGTIRDPNDADLAAVLGLGFPERLGGPLAYLKALGFGRALSLAQRLSEALGPRFSPPHYLSEKAGH